MFHVHVVLSKTKSNSIFDSGILYCCLNFPPRAYTRSTGALFATSVSLCVAFEEPLMGLGRLCSNVEAKFCTFYPCQSCRGVGEMYDSEQVIIWSPTLQVHVLAFRCISSSKPGHIKGECDRKSKSNFAFVTP